MPAQGFVPVDLRLLVIKVMTHGWDLSKAMYLCVRACGRVCLLHVFLCIVVLGGGAFLVAQQIWHCVWGGKKNSCRWHTEKVHYKVGTKRREEVGNVQRRKVGYAQTKTRNHQAGVSKLEADASIRTLPWSSNCWFGGVQVERHANAEAPVFAERFPAFFRNQGNRELRHTSSRGAHMVPSIHSL